MRKYFFLLTLMTLPLMAQTGSFDVDIHEPGYFKVAVPDGNYRVTVTLGAPDRASQTVVRAENRRLMVENAFTLKGKYVDYEFVVNKRSVNYVLDGKEGVVKIKEREKDYFTWDEFLTLEFNGPSPAVKRITIQPDTTATTIFLCGNSTVVDQATEPWASWGQMIPKWFGPQVAISNHAESGLTARTFLASNRLDQILSMMRPGDYVICEFGHNDEKEHADGDGPWYHYTHNLKIFVDKVRKRGGTIIFCTPTQRRFWEDDQKHIRNTHGEFPEAMKVVAERENVPVIDLNAMTKSFFETLGVEDSKRALVFYPANTYPNQEKELADNTHFNPYGAYEVAKMVVQGMVDLKIPIVDGLREKWKTFNPATPDDWKTFKWYDADATDTTKPDGN